MNLAFWLESEKRRKKREERVQDGKVGFFTCCMWALLNSWFDLAETIALSPLPESASLAGAKAPEINSSLSRTDVSRSTEPHLARYFYIDL